MEQLIAKVEGLRQFYPPDSRVGKLLDQLAADLRKGKPRKKVLTEARRVQKLLGPSATAHRMIAHVTSALGAPDI